LIGLIKLDCCQLCPVVAFAGLGFACAMSGCAATDIIVSTAGADLAYVTTSYEVVNSPEWPYITYEVRVPGLVAPVSRIELVGKRDNAKAFHTIYYSRYPVNRQASFVLVIEVPVTDQVGAVKLLHELYDPRVGVRTFIISFPCGSPPFVCLGTIVPGFG
jgi:hypothetical protein